MEQEVILKEKLELIKEHLNKTLGVEYSCNYMIITHKIDYVKITIHNRRTLSFQAFVINSDYIIVDDYLKSCKLIMKIMNK